jgi:hypothetical protein
MRDVRDFSFSTGPDGQAGAAEAMARRRRREEEQAVAARSLRPSAPQPQPPDLAALPEAVLDSLPWPGEHRSQNPPAWMLEEDPPSPTPTAAKPPAISAYEQEWKTLHPKAQNPWHTMDEEEHKTLIHPINPQQRRMTAGEMLQREMGKEAVGSHHKRGLKDVTHPSIPTAADALPPRPMAGSSSMGQLLPGRAQRPLPALPPRNDFASTSTTREPRVGPVPLPEAPLGTPPFSPQLDLNQGPKDFPRPQENRPDTSLPSPKTMEAPAGMHVPAFELLPAKKDASPRPSASGTGPLPKPPQATPQPLPEIPAGQVQVFTDIGHYLTSGDPQSSELLRGFVEGVPFTDPRTGRPALLAASVRPQPGEDQKTALERTLRTAAEASVDPHTPTHQPPAPAVNAAPLVLTSPLADSHPQEPARQPETAGKPPPQGPAHPRQTEALQPRLEWRMERAPGRDDAEQNLRVAGAWRVEDLPAFFQDPMLKDSTPEQRQQLLNDVLRQAGAELAHRPGFSRQDYLDYQAVAEAARQRVADMTTWGEKARGIGGVVADVGRSVIRGAIATATDATVADPNALLDPETSGWRLPFGNVAQQAGYWVDKAADSAETLWTSGAGKELDSGLAGLEKDLAEGNVPLGDRAAFDAWLDAHSARLSQAQAAWYEAAQGTGEKITRNGKEEVMDQDWIQTYSRSNGLNAPHNAALLAEYLNTRDPQVLRQLSESLKKTPRRAAIERDQQESLDKSQVVNFLTGLTGADYKQAMMEAGNPLEIASNLVPFIRGARTAGKVGGGIARTAGSAAGSVAADLAIEAANLTVENPQATLEDYLVTGRDTVAAALGLHAAGVAAGKVAQGLAPSQKTPLPDTASTANTPAPSPQPPSKHAGTGESKPPGTTDPVPPPTAQDMPPGQPEDGPPVPPLADPLLPVSEFNPQVITEGRRDGVEASPPAPPTPSTLDEVHADAARQGLMPPVHEQDGRFIVTDHEGTPATFDNRQEAVEAAFAFMTPEQRQKVIAMVEAGQKSTPGHPPHPMPSDRPPDGTERRPDPASPDARPPLPEKASGRPEDAPPGPPSAEGPPIGQADTKPPPPAPPTLDEVHADAARQGLMPPVHEQPDGKFIVTDHEGTPATFDNRAEAVEAAFAFMTPQQRQKVIEMIKQKQKAAIQKTAPVKKQAVTATVGGDPPQNFDGDTGQAEAVTSGSTTETGTAPARASMPQANPQTVQQGASPPAQPSQPANTPPPLWQGSIGRDAQGQDKKVVIRQRNADGSYKVQTPEGQSIRLSPEAYESMTGAKPEPTPTAADPAGKLSDEAESGPLWHVPIRDTHELPKLPYDTAHKPSGPRKVMSKKDTHADNIRATNGENEAADVMARHGYQIEQIKESDKSPDLRINNIPDKADVYSPQATKNLKGIWDFVSDKVGRQNAPYVVIRLEPDGQEIGTLNEYFRENPIEGVKQIFVVKADKLYIIK